MTAHRHARASLALFAVAVAAAALLPRAAAASKADAFEGKIQPVSGQLYRKAGRFELTLGVDRSLNDAFFVKTFGDVKLGYHFTESLSAHVHGAAGFSSPTSSTTVCPTGQACRSATEAELRQVPGRVRSIVGAEVEWAPIYGKLNTFSEKVAHIDLAVIGGVDLIGHDEVLNATAAAAGAPALKNTVGFHVGLGTRVFWSETFAVRLDLKDYVYGVRVPNGQPANGIDVQNQLFLELGVSVFFPFENRRQP